MASSLFPSHQTRVAAKFPEHTYAHTVALYHDHLEDGLGDVPRGALPTVEILTRRPNEPYFAYIRRIRDSRNGVAVIVKRADLEDNIVRCRGEHGGRVDPGLARRYESALKILDV